MITLNTCYTQQIYTGLEADTKPLGVPNGSLFLVMDTGKVYRFDAQNQTWIDQANPTPTGGNDMFIVTLTRSESTYTADKTVEEIIAALASGKIPVAIVDDDHDGQTSYDAYYFVAANPGEITFRSMSCDSNGVYSTDLYIDANGVDFSEQRYPVVHNV